MTESEASTYSVYISSDPANGIYDYDAQAVALLREAEGTDQPAGTPQGPREPASDPNQPTTSEPVLQRPTFFPYSEYVENPSADQTATQGQDSDPPAAGSAGTAAGATKTPGGEPSLFHDADLDISSLVSIVSNSALSHVRVLGSGNFGVTFRALLRDRNASEDSLTPVVVKVSRSQSSAGAKAGASGVEELRELAFAAMLPAHRNVVPLLGVVTDFSRPRAPYLAHFGIVVPLIDGGDAQSWLAGLVDEMPRSLLLQIALQMALGLRHVHGNGLVHLDVALRNFLIDEELDVDSPAEVRVLLSDFGLTRRLTELQQRPRELAPRVVPWPWWPVEALAKREFSFATDVWSFGVALWELFSPQGQQQHATSSISTSASTSTSTSTGSGGQQQQQQQQQGRRPFSEASTPSALAKLIRSGVNLADRLPPSCPAIIVDLVRRCTTIDPATRPTMAEVVDALTQSLGTFAGPLVSAAEASVTSRAAASDDDVAARQRQAAARAAAAEAAAKPKSALSKVKSLLAALDRGKSEDKTLFKRAQKFSKDVARRLRLAAGGKAHALKVFKLMSDAKLAVHVTTRFGNIPITSTNVCAADFGAGWLYLLGARQPDSVAESLGKSHGGGTTFFFVLRDDVCAAVLEALDQGQYEYNPPVARLADGSLPSLADVLEKSKGADVALYNVCKARSEQLRSCMGMTDDRMEQLDRSGEDLPIVTGQGTFVYSVKNVCGAAYDDAWTVMLVPKSVVRPGVQECGSGTTHIVVLDDVAHSLVVRAVGPSCYGRPMDYNF